MFHLTSTYRSQGGYKNDAELQVAFANIHAVTCRCRISKCTFCKCIFSNHSSSSQSVEGGGGGYCLRYGADVDVFVYVACHLNNFTFANELSR
jgi:hypothetical protein